MPLESEYFQTTCISPFIPEFLKLTLPSLNLDMSFAVNRYFRLNSKHRLVNSIDPDETARYEPSHHDIFCLHRSA